MNRDTGRAITGLAHLRQSIADILTTPIGSRVMRRDYGSQLPELIDEPLNDTTRLRLYAAAVTALMRWEPRLRLTRIQLDTIEAGRATLAIEGVTIDRGESLNLQVPLALGAVA